jgi:nicotinamide-nucleotide amidase
MARDDQAVPAPGNAALLKLARRLAGRLSEQGRLLATAESCTGGLIAKCLTDVPGSSVWFERGWVTYSDRSKRQELGVAGGMIKQHGAVSERVARAMARGALQFSLANVSVAVTGIAGPEGGTPEKPVGTVWIAWAWREGVQTRVESRRFLFAGNRDAVRRQTAEEVMKGLLEG